MAFEGYADEWFGMGDSFDTESLSINNNNPLHLEFQTTGADGLNYFLDAVDLANLAQEKTGPGIKPDVIEKYCVPNSVNFASVDGLVFSAVDTFILLQIRIAKTHDIEPTGVKRLYNALLDIIKYIEIVFVISDVVIHEYSKTKSVPKASAIKPKAKDSTISQ